MNNKNSKLYYFIYLTTNIIDNKSYVGFRSTNNVNDGYLGSGLLLKYQIGKYGCEIFKKQILEFCDKNNWQEREKYWIKEKDTLFPKGYNLSEGGDGGNLGEIINDKIALKNKGRIVSEETKRKISQSEKGKTLSLETKKKMSESHKGLKQSNETILKRIQKLKGKKLSEQTRSKISKANSGRGFGKNLKNKPLKQCTHCNKILDISNYAKYHGDKCKFKL